MEVVARAHMFVAYIDISAGDPSLIQSSAIATSSDSLSFLGLGEIRRNSRQSRLPQPPIHRSMYGAGDYNIGAHANPSIQTAIPAHSHSLRRNPSNTVRNHTIAQDINLVREPSKTTYLSPLFDALW